MNTNDVHKDKCNQRHRKGCCSDESRPTAQQDRMYHWRVGEASVRGTSHEKKGQPCQDAHYWDTLPEGVLVVAVADGAGSAALGEVGAAVAAQTAVEAICPQIRPPGARLWDDEDWKVLLTGCIKTARIAVETEAVELNNST